ncbi:MAG TPA: Yip1 family protein [Sphingobium sp.]|nr:Yip1 family protein [Sphingobium sp.]
MTNGSGFSRDSIIARAKAIIRDPNAEWPRIAAEQRSITEIFIRYSIPLAAVGPVAGFLGGQIFGYGMFGISYRPGLATGLSMAALSFLLSLAGIVILTIIVELLAPKFGGAADRPRAFKLVAYSMTAAALAGIFGIIPALAWLGIVGLYSFYLFYTGVAPMLNIPAEKAAMFTVVTFVCAMLFYLVAGIIMGSMGNVIGMRPGIPTAERMGDSRLAVSDAPALLRGGAESRTY